jgi:hypothetical protein
MHSIEFDIYWGGQMYSVEADILLNDESFDAHNKMGFLAKHRRISAEVKDLNIYFGGNKVSLDDGIKEFAMEHAITEFYHQNDMI